MRASAIASWLTWRPIHRGCGRRENRAGVRVRAPGSSVTARRAATRCDRRRRYCRRDRCVDARAATLMAARCASPRRSMAVQRSMTTARPAAWAMRPPPRRRPPAAATAPLRRPTPPNGPPPARARHVGRHRPGRPARSPRPPPPGSASSDAQHLRRVGVHRHALVAGLEQGSHHAVAWPARVRRRADDRDAAVLVRSAAATPASSSTGTGPVPSWRSRMSRVPAQVLRIAASSG